jgi:hypothetical protein
MDMNKQWVESLNRMVLALWFQLSIRKCQALFRLRKYPTSETARNIHKKELSEIRPLISSQQTKLIPAYCNTLGIQNRKSNFKVRSPNLRVYPYTQNNLKGSNPR